jgi:hypothetical protein
MRMRMRSSPLIKVESRDRRTAATSEEASVGVLL